MKKILTFILFIFVSLTFVNSSHAYIVNLVDKDYPLKTYSMYADITGDGSTSIEITLGLNPGTVADIRAVYFDYASSSPITILQTVGAETITNWYDTYTGGSINDLSADVKINGATNYVFNVGIEFGDEGIGEGKGDIQLTTFTLTSSSDITLGDFFGGRLMSVGVDASNRTDSSKLTGSTDDPTTGTVPEPTTLMLFSSALAGIFIKQRFIS